MSFPDDDQAAALQYLNPGARDFLGLNDPQPGLTSFSFIIFDISNPKPTAMSPTTNLTFDEAVSALNEGLNVRLPEWTGYWFKDPKDGGIKVHTRTGDIIDTPHYSQYAHRTDWEVVRKGLGFDFAILALKAGKKVARLGWNGKNMYIFIRPADTLAKDFIPKVKSLPDSVKESLAATGEDVLFTAYLCMKAADGTIVNGWLASQTDLLAEDWLVVR